MWSRNFPKVLSLLLSRVFLTSSGAVVAALLERAAELPSGYTVAIVLHDGGQPYLDTIYNDAWVTERFDISAADLARGVDDWGSE